MNSNHFLVPITLVVAFCLSPFVCLIIAIISAAYWNETTALAASTIAGVVIWGPLLILAWLYRPVRRRESKVWIYIAGTISCGFAWITIDSDIQVFAISLLVDLLNRCGVDIPADRVFSGSQTSFVVFCCAMVALAFIFGWRNRSPIAYQSRVQNEIPSGVPELKASANEVAMGTRNYVGALVDFLNGYDRQLNWSDRSYVSLEAEVETETPTGRHKLVQNLTEAIREDQNSMTFIVIGDPGGGKSVSLRNLVRSVAKEAEKTKVLPVYANLREFPADNEVTTSALIDFLRSCVREQTGRDGDALLEGWYDNFRATSRLFFVIDSFDELPQILDADDQSDTHDKVCEAFDKLFTQELRNCRKVLASRPFRAPAKVQGARLRVRSLNEKQIRTLVRNRVIGQGFDPDEFVLRVFRDRSELVPLLRNPFTAELLTSFARNNAGELPASTFDIFDSHVSVRLEKDKNRIAERYQVDSKKVRSAARELASLMFESDRGLEIDRSTAIERLSFSDSENVLEALRYCRLLRMGGNDQTLVAFAHRRFAEFFAVESLIAKHASPPMTGIPSDSRWRDGLVMYCGVADEKQKREVADYCWRVLETHFPAVLDGDRGNLTACIHCIRFLVDAFRGDTKSLDEFIGEFGLLVQKATRSSDSLLKKFAIESIPIVEPFRQQRLILRAMNSKKNWIRTTAVNGCRNIPRLTKLTEGVVRDYYRATHPVEKLLNYKEMDFTLSLSEAFRKIRRRLFKDILEILGFYLCFATAAYFLIWFKPATFAAIGVGFIAIVFFVIVARFLFDAPPPDRTTKMVGKIVGKPLVSFAKRSRIDLSNAKHLPRLNPKFAIFHGPLKHVALYDALLVTSIFLSMFAIDVHWLPSILLLCAVLVSLWGWDFPFYCTTDIRRSLPIIVFLALPTLGIFAVANLLKYLFGPFGFYVFIAVMSLFLIYLVGVLVFTRVAAWYSDRKILAAGVPNQLTTVYLIDVLKDLSVPGRRMFLKALFIKRAQLSKNEAATIRESDVIDAMISQDKEFEVLLSRLREFWLGLAT